MSTVVAVASSVNTQLNHVNVFAINADRIPFVLTNPDVLPLSGWAQLPTVPGSATPVALTAVYRPQFNHTVLTVAMGDNTSYTIQSPAAAGAAWVALSAIPTT